MCTKLFFWKVLTKCIFLITVSANASINYCSPKFCNNSKQHTLCRFPFPEPSHECIDYERTIKNIEQKEGLLDKINSRRDKIASGDVRSFPTAENMMRLTWSEELEKSAQRWADQCVGENTPNHEDMCRDLGDVSVGQSVASVYGEAPGLSPLSLVDVWYMELLNVNSSVLPRYRPSSERGLSHYDYFTQLVWARSSEVGCGSVRFKERLKSSQFGKNRTVYRLVCNFAPSGNVLGEAVYSEGPACSRCPGGSSCDSTYSSLCSTIKSQKPETLTTEKLNTQNRLVVSDKKIFMDKSTSEADSQANDENSTMFDYFSEMYDFTREPITTATTQSENVCKNALGVDEFVELLKKKLTTDPMFKELLSTKQPQNGNVDISFTDPSVAAFVSKLYSKKEPVTTTKLPDQEYVNSTLLVDLVEAVIFRSGDKTYASDEPKIPLQSVSDVTPVKIQAELAEVRLNHDFTGHYFFPEDISEETVQETTDLYYDTSNLPASDVIFEIESIKRDKVTEDFLEEIIDSDTGNDESKRKRKRRSEINDPQNEYGIINDYYYDSKENKRIKLSMASYHDSNIVVKYSDLLQRIASDFKLLKLNERFHCSCSQNHAKILKITISLKIILLFTIFWDYIVYW